MELSIIIPMYNAVSSIERCLVSTQRQNIAKTDYEVIVINDGSTDNSLEVADRVASRYSNIKLYSQENGGLSRARNAGLDKAKGDYIFFLDSDDCIAENCLEKIISKCKEHNLDILRICAANVIDGVPKRRFTLNEDKVVKGIEELRKWVVACAPFSICRRAFLNKHDLRFFPGIFHEDNEFTPRVYYFAERVASINDIMYFVYQTPGSITRSVNVKKTLDMIIVIQNLDEFYQKYVRKEDEMTFHRIIAGAINSTLHQTFNYSKEEKRKINEAFHAIRHLFKHARKSPTWEYRLTGWMYTIFSHHVVEVYHALHFRL